MKEMPQRTQEKSQIASGFEDQRHNKMKRQRAWDSLVETYESEIGQFNVIPLTSSSALLEEGIEMFHCVGKYDRACHQGLKRVFSIRDRHDERAATLALIFRDDNWQIEQIKGNGNWEVCLSERSYIRDVWGNHEFDCTDMDHCAHSYIEMDGEQEIYETDYSDLYCLAHEVRDKYRMAWAEWVLSAILNAARVPANSEISI